MKSLFVALSVFLLVSHEVRAFDHSHGKLQKVLKSHVKVQGPQTLFNYSELKKSPTVLNAYLGELSSVSKANYQGFTQDQKLAFLINAYNAFTLKLIIDHYPKKSIRDIGGLFSSPWRKKFFKLLGEDTHLDHIEHGIIRKKFSEPRIHFAVNCASIGCPNLQSEAFTEKNLETLLEKGKVDFFADKTKNNYNKKEKTFNLSKIFKWYGDDFKPKHGSVKNYAAKIYKVSKTEAKDIDIEYTDYDWNLNEWK